MTAKSLRLRVLSIPALLACLPPVLLTSGQASAQSGPSIEQIVESPLREIIKRDGIPGLSCAVMVRDRVLYANGFGFADLENDVPATDRTVYRLASISKPITAILLMQIAERGDLDLDKAIYTIVPEWPKKRWPVTSRQLLAHLGGVRHYKPLEGESTKRYDGQLAGLERFADDRLLHEPGTKYRYSTFGYNLLAAVVETHYGKSFGEVVEERLAVPCKAKSLQDDDQRRLIKWRAQGYRKRGGKLTNSRLMDSSYKLGGGGLCSSATDLARVFANLQLGKLVKPATLEQMWTRQKTRSNEEIKYGLGFTIGTAKGLRFAAHSGAQSRVSTMMCMLPDDQITVVVMCNLEGVRLSSVARSIAVDVRNSLTPQPAKKGGGGR